MNFEWALSVMKRGGEVSRAMWDDVPSTMNTYVKVFLETDEGRFPDLVAVLGDGTRCSFILNGHMLMAEDWTLA